MLPRQVRQLIQARLNELAGCDVQITGETLLIRDSEYCGHRFESDRISAVWFHEEREIKFYDAANGMIQSIDVDEMLGQKVTVIPKMADRSGTDNPTELRACHPEHAASNQNLDAERDGLTGAACESPAPEPKSNAA